jgi:putative transposase
LGAAEQAPPPDKGFLNSSDPEGVQLFCGGAMASTLTKILVHFIFSTKNRAAIITPEIEPRLHAYMRGISKNHGSPTLAMNGMPDHVHMLISMSKTIAAADLMEVVKKESSKWIKKEGQEFSEFHWQDGYAGFSIGESGLEQVRHYIDNQKSHHERMTFKEELLMFLKKYNVEYDERYIWT